MKKNSLFIITVLLAVLILFFATLPGVILTKYKILDNKIIFKLAHLVGFAMLTILFLNTFSEAIYKKNNMLVNFLVIIVTMSLAIYIEIKQTTIPGREASIIDIALDSTGIFLGFCAIRLCKRINIFLAK